MSTPEQEPRPLADRLVAAAALVDQKREDIRRRRNVAQELVSLYAIGLQAGFETLRVPVSVRVVRSEYSAGHIVLKGCDRSTIRLTVSATYIDEGGVIMWLLCTSWGSDYERWVQQPDVDVMLYNIMRWARECEPTKPPGPGLLTWIWRKITRQRDATTPPDGTAKYSHP